MATLPVGLSVSGSSLPHRAHIIPKGQPFFLERDYQTSRIAGGVGRPFAHTGRPGVRTRRGQVHLVRSGLKGWDEKQQEAAECQ